MNDELQRLWNEAVMASLKTPSQHSHEGELWKSSDKNSLGLAADSLSITSAPAPTCWVQLQLQVQLSLYLRTMP